MSGSPMAGAGVVVSSRLRGTPYLPGCDGRGSLLRRWTAWTGCTGQRRPAGCVAPRFGSGWRTRPCRARCWAARKGWRCCKRPQAARCLKEAGVDRYNHNLNTSNGPTRPWGRGWPRARMQGWRVRLGRPAHRTGLPGMRPAFSRRNCSTAGSRSSPEGCSRAWRFSWAWKRCRAWRVASCKGSGVEAR